MLFSGRLFQLRFRYVLRWCTHLALGGSAIVPSSLSPAPDTQFSVVLVYS